MNKQLLASVVLLAVVAVVGVVYPRPLPTQVIKETIEKLGAFPSPELLTDYLSFNGIRRFYNRQAIRTATTTICAFRAPKATSTLTFASWDLVISSSTQVTVLTIAKAANGFATTTMLAEVGIAAGAKSTGYITGSSTVNLAGTTVPGQGVLASFIFSPTTGTTSTSGDWLVFGFAGGQHPTTGRPTGTCQAEFTAF